MAYQRIDTIDGVTRMNKVLYDNLQDGIEECMVTNQIKISNLIAEHNIEISSDGFYDITAYIPTIQPYKAIVIDVDCKSTVPFILKSYHNITSPNSSKIKFVSTIGFTTSENIENVNIHDLIISGDRTNGNILIDIEHNIVQGIFDSLIILNGDIGIYVNGWMITFNNIHIFNMIRHGIYVKKTDLTFNNISIGGCYDSALYLDGGSNSRYSNFKILGSGRTENTPYSVQIIGCSRSQFSNIEIQDVFYRALRLETCVKNNININIDTSVQEFRQLDSLVYIYSRECMSNEGHIICHGKQPDVYDIGGFIGTLISGDGIKSFPNEYHGIQLQEEVPISSLTNYNINIMEENGILKLSCVDQSNIGRLTGESSHVYLVVLTSLNASLRVNSFRSLTYNKCMSFITKDNQILSVLPNSTAMICGLKVFDITGNDDIMQYLN